jgi:type VI secretion system secreted protein Hcp
MAFDCFLKIDGIDGESTDSKHASWIEVLSFSHGMSQPVSAVQSTAGGAAAARVNMQDFVVAKHIDIASPKLAEACCTGKHFGSVLVELCRAGGDKLKYMEYKLTNSIISSVTVGGAPGGAEDVPVEQVSFNFGKLEWKYTQQKRADGGGGGNASAGWDLQKNAKV